MNSEEILASYVESSSQELFRKLVEQHTGLVLSVAMRRLGGDRSRAEDVHQEVFVLLAKKAEKLSKHQVIVSAWLYRQTMREASNMMRSEGRRRLRESRAGEGARTSGQPSESHILGEVDEAMSLLSETERQLLLCRFADELEFGCLGKRLGISEEAARKRLNRALAKLREILSKRGLSVSVQSLTAAMLGFSKAPLQGSTLL